MKSVEELKAGIQVAIDRRMDWMVDVSKAILASPEPGFCEVKTSRLVAQKLDELGIAYETGIALTGVKGYIRGARPGPTVALIGELDSLRVLGHPHADPDTAAAHACGHHCQIGTMLGAAAALSAPEVREALSGNVALMAVPAEEFIDVEYRWGLHQAGMLGLMSGKQEFIRLGAFDDVDMSMMVHTSSRPQDRSLAVGGSSNGHVVKFVTFIGRASHAGGAPHLGINALQAATVALTALNAQRETMREEDTIRLHGIMTAGGVSVNSVPADVRYEGRVRGRSAEAIDDANMKMDRCMRAGALALGATVKIVTIPGYLPMLNNEPLMAIFRQNGVRVVGEENFTVHDDGRHRGGSTDMGDVSHIMPAIHPYAGGATGSGHGIDYVVQDYDKAVVTPAKVMAMTVVDLLADDGAGARGVLEQSPPKITKARYLEMQESRLKEELYEGR